MKKRRKINRDAVRKRAADRKRGFGSEYLSIPEGMELFQPKEGQMRIDVLPYELTDKRNPVTKKYDIQPGDIYHERTFYVHRAVGPDGAIVVCPARTAGKPCPICEERQRMALQPDSDPDDVRALQPKERQVFCVKELEKGKDNPLKIWDMSFFLFGDRLNKEILAADEDEMADMFADLEDGSELRLMFAEKSMGKNRFLECESIRFKPRKTAYPESVIDEVPNLDDLLIIKSYEELKQLFFGLEADDAEADEPPPRRPARGKAEPEPDEDDDYEDDDDDYEDDPPPRRPARGKAEPDDEEDEDDEYEDDPPPRQSRRSRLEQGDERENMRRTPDEDDEDDEAEPAPPRRSARPAPPPDEDEDMPRRRRKRKQPVDDEGNPIPF